MNDTIRDIELFLRRADFAVRVEGRKVLSSLGVTPPQFSALQFIVKYKDNPISIGDLSRSMGLAFSTVTDLIDRMEKLGFVERKKDEKDKRVIRISPLEKGVHILDEVVDHRVNFVDSVIDGHYTDEEKKHVRDELKKLSELLKENKDILEKKN